MSNRDIIRAWKDEAYRQSLSNGELSALPQNPAGIIELSDAELEGITGANTEYLMTVGCCIGFTAHTCAWCPPPGTRMGRKTDATSDRHTCAWCPPPGGR
jgi:mersacidin/lichenicidin family type 2 lantibiotic